MTRATKHTLSVGQIEASVIKSRRVQLELELQSVDSFIQSFSQLTVLSRASDYCALTILTIRQNMLSARKNPRNCIRQPKT
jgi:hypothetical protein